MKKLVMLLILFVTSLLSANEEVGTAAAVAVEETPTAPSDWRNWVFAASALVTLAVGVVIVSTNTGTYNH